MKEGETMNILLWALQVLLALHTVMGAVWKFSNPAQTVPSLSMIPHGVWLALSVVELLGALGLVLPAFSRRLGVLAPVAALFIAAEMLFYTGLTVFSANAMLTQIVYWLVVMVVAGFIACGRLVWKPLNRLPRTS
jgi:hypothetical protein